MHTLASIVQLVRFILLYARSTLLASSIHTTKYELVV